MNRYEALDDYLDETWSEQMEREHRERVRQRALAAANAPKLRGTYVPPALERGRRKHGKVLAQ